MSIKRKAVFEDSNTGRMARVYWDNEQGEAIVKFYAAGQYQYGADYFTNDFADAEGTAKAFIASSY